MANAKTDEELFNRKSYSSMSIWLAIPSLNTKYKYLESFDGVNATPGGYILLTAGLLQILYQLVVLP